MTKNNAIIRERIINGLKLTYERLIKDKIERNLQLIVSENGKVQHVDPIKFQKK